MVCDSSCLFSFRATQHLQVKSLMPEVYGDSKRRPTVVRGERQYGDKDSCRHPHPRGQRQQQQRRSLERGGTEDDDDDYGGGGTLRAPVGIAAEEVEEEAPKKKGGEAGSGGARETAAETAAGISRAKALAAAGDLLAAV